MDVARVHGEPAEIDFERRRGLRYLDRVDLELLVSAVPDLDLGLFTGAGIVTERGRTSSAPNLLRPRRDS
jgi:hypothetical protein